jgi:hypothetical protein
VAKQSPVESITFVPHHLSIADADITQMPVWYPMAEVILHDGAHKFEPLGQLMPKREAWRLAEQAMANRGDVLSVAVRRCADVALGVTRRAALS